MLPKLHFKSMTLHPLTKHFAQGKLTFHGLPHVALACSQILLYMISVLLLFFAEMFRLCFGF